MKLVSRVRPAYVLRFAAGCALVFLLAPFTPAQSDFQTTYRITKISVTGQQHFAESAIVAATGLSVGQTATPEDISAAAGRLARFDAFDNVNFRYITDGKNLDVILEVTESKHLLPCRFDNFVWLSPADLDAALRQRVPLYDGSAPPAGAMLLAIENTLQGILKERGVLGTVAVVAYSPAPGMPVSAMRFDVQGVSLPIGQLSFPGASAISEDELRMKAATLLGENYSLTDVAIFANASLIPLYGERGYLRAQFDQPIARLEASDGPAGMSVAVAIPVREGLSYEWNGALWSGNHVFTATDLDRMLGMRPSEVANTEKYQRGIQDVNDAYSKQGYIQLVISAQPEFDDAARRVTYRISVQEGPQYRMGSLEILGLPADAASRLLKSWKLQQGDVFDQTYVKAFLQVDLPKNLHFNPSKPVNVSSKEQVDPNAKKVNVQIGVK